MVMWSISLIRRLGDLSVRHITLLVLAISMALFATLAVSTASVRAQEAAGNATRSGEDLVYNGNTYEKLASAPSQNEDFTFYASACRQSSGEVYVRSVRGTSAENGVGAICMISTGRAWYVWFPNAHPASDGQSLIFGDGTITEQYKNIIVAVQDRYERYDGFPASMAAAGEPKNLSIPNPKPAGLSEDEWVAMWSDVAQKFHANIQDQVRITIDGNGEGTTTCSSEHTHGLGWIICPVTNLLADIMDRLYEQIQKFLTVAPLATDRENPMYFMWNMMRNFANIMFIIGFLFIIYSQITSYGMSNYGMKRLLPRLLIAAVLVNISYWIVALAIDLSNITGRTFYDALVGIRKSMPQPQGIDYDFSTLSWTALASTILAGGAGGALAIGAIGGVFVSAGGSLWFLLVGLMGVITAGLIAVIILAARQALITILVIISPLAFVAYLLPSTEKYFDKWKDLLLTLLLVYPIVSIVFGGAQLAGLAIMHSARPGDTENAPILIILGMVVQVAPLIITPLLIRVSGSLLGRIAGIVNNPNRGLVDQTRKFAQRRHDMTKNSMWGSTGRDANGNIIYRRNDPLAMAARRKALRDMDFDHKLKTLEGGAEAAYEQDHRSHDVHLQSSINEMLKSQGSDAGKVAVSREIAHTDALRRLYYQQQASHDAAETENKAVRTMFEGLKANPEKVVANEDEREIGRQALQYNITSRALDYRADSARNIQEAESNNAVIKNEMTINGQSIRNFAGFSEIDTLGASRMSSVAQQKEAEAYQKRIAAPQAAQNKVEATPEDLLDIMQGNTPKSGFATGIRDHADFVEGRAAAIRNIGDGSPVKHIHELIRQLNLTESATSDEEAMLRSEVAGVGRKGRTVYLSKTTSSNIAAGKIDSSLRGEALMNKLIRETADSGAFSVSGIASSIDRDDIGLLAQYIADGGTLKAETMDQLRSHLRTVTTDPRFSSTLDKRKNEVGALWDAVGMGVPRPPDLL